MVSTAHGAHGGELDGLGELLLRLNGHKEPLNTVFESMAVELPRLSNAIRDLLAGLGTLVSERSSGSVEGALSSTSQVLANVSQMVRSEVSRTQPLLTATAELAAHVEAISSIVGGIRSLAIRLRVTGLNASTSAENLLAGGSGAGRVFSALSRELVRITDSSMETATRISNPLDGVAGAVSELAALRAATESAVLQQAAVAESKGAGAGAAARALLERFGSSLRQSKARFEELEAPIRRVMMSIQRQDGIRQSYEHLGAVLRGLEAGASVGLSREERLARAAAAGELCATMAAEIRRSVDAVLAEAEREVTALDVRGQELAEGTQVLMKELQGEFRERVTAPAALVRELLDGLRAQRERRASFASVAQGLGKRLVDLAKGFDALKLIADEFQIVRLLIEMEIHRSSELKLAGSVVAQVREGRAAFGELLLRAEPIVQGLQDSRAALGKLLGFKGLGGAQDGALSELERQLDAHAEAVEGMMSALTEKLGFAQSLGRDVASRSRRIGDGIKASRVRLSTFGELEQALRAFGAAARGALDAAGGEDDPATTEAVRRWLQETSASFAVLTNKHQAAELGQWTVERGEAGGSLTLF